MRILLRTPNYLGDTVMITPALELLRRTLPDAEFWFWGSRFNEELFGGEENYGGSLVHPRGQGWNAYLSQLGEIRARQFDAAILFATQLRDVVLSRLGRIPRVVGTIKKDTRLLLDSGVQYSFARHRVNHFALLADAGFASGERILPPVRLRPRTNDLIAGLGGPRIGVLLGGPHKGLRAYPPAMAAQLIDELAGIGGHIFLLGDTEDEEAASRWLPRDHSARNLHVLAGKTTVGGLADAIGSMDVMVTIDTGALHLASALDVPFVSLVGFGTSSYCTIRPQGRGIHLLPPEHILRDEEKIRSIRPSRIVSAVLALLETPGSLTATEPVALQFAGLHSVRLSPE